LYESEILRASVFLVAFLAEPLVLLIDISLGRSAATDMGVADPTFLMIPTVPLHVGKHMVTCKLGPELGPTVVIADSKMLGVGRYEPAALPGGCLQNHVDVVELPRTGKPGHDAADLNEIALNPQRRGKNAAPRYRVILDEIARPLGIAAI
jgi:hypothetical protein